MTHETKIAGNLSRLTEIRKELALVKAQRRTQCKQLEDAGMRAGADPDPNREWPSPQDVQRAWRAIKTLQEEADTLIHELKELGIEPELFRLNGSSAPR